MKWIVKGDNRSDCQCGLNTLFWPGMGTCPDTVRQLVSKFDEQADQYRSPDYNETQVRIDFINPMFKALGWAMDNIAGYAEPYRDVVHEDAVKIGGTTKSPDYSFRVGGQRKFFLEAKKPAVHVRMDLDPAYQIRRYAWTAKLPLSILTNFEEFAVYDCRVAPKYLDKASAARVLYMTCTAYVERWNEIASVFSKESILHGAFDRFIESHRKAGTQEFDEAFLDEMEQWRKKLAENIALRNSLDQAGLNFSVQRVIDRIIFLRISEDRGVEPAFQLQGLLSGENTYARLRELFNKSDQRYNSGLFHFHREKERHEQPDELTPRLEIDDAALKYIIKRLYYPDSPYVFKEVPADILGNVYERFLGNVIHLTSAHHVRIEPKPEVRKAGGVYYTPTDIVDYIVKHTVGKLLEGKTPKEAAKLRVLDPACGSGSFLLGAYQYLLEWHHQWYLKDDVKRWSRGRSATLRPGPGGQPLLTTKQRKRILLDSIFGVDLDDQAVEVTKLSLLLKVLEGETSESVDALSRLFHERALPDLGDSIKCGNSLVGTDIMNSEEWKVMNERDKRRINPFDFELAFPREFEHGGFDAVIGNPPWGQKDIAKDVFLDGYIRNRFKSVVGIFDLYRPFVELALRVARPGALVGQVLPDIILLKDYETTRRLLLDKTTLRQIDWWGMAFDDAVIDATTIVASREPVSPDHRVEVAVREGHNGHRSLLRQADFARNPRCTFNLILTDDRRELIERLNSLPRLAEFFEVHEGVHSGNIRDELFVDRAVDQSCRELIFGRDEIAPYRLDWNGRYIHLNAMPVKKTPQRYANIGQALWHEKSKVLVRRTGDYVLAAVDAVGRYCSNNFFLVFPLKDHPLNLHGLCAVLNSRIMTAYFRLIEPRKGRVFSELKIKHLGQFPVPALDQIEQIRKLNELGERRAQVAHNSAKASLPVDKERLFRESDQLDRTIDEMTSRILAVSAEDWECLNDLMEA